MQGRLPVYVTTEHLKSIALDRKRKQAEKYIPSLQQQKGSLRLDFEDLVLSSKHTHQDMQVQSSTILEAPLMQLNSCKISNIIRYDR